MRMGSSLPPARQNSSGPVSSGVMLIRFDFVGGPKDGESVFGDLNGEFGAAAACYYASRGCTPGTVVWCRSPYLVELMELLSDSALLDLHRYGSPLRGHLYEVLCRSAGETDIRIRARHLGPTRKRTVDCRI